MYLTKNKELFIVYKNDDDTITSNYYFNEYPATLKTLINDLMFNGLNDFIIYDGIFNIGAKPVAIVKNGKRLKVTKKRFIILLNKNTLE